MSVFGSLYADRYDAMYAAKDYSGECDIVETMFRRHGATPQSILDIGCGTGRHVSEFASRGYRCTGVDLSPAMLALARANAEARTFENAPAWVEGDARTFDAKGTFDAAVMMFAVVSYLTTNDDVLTGLANIRRHLSPGALFICDFWYGPAVLSVRPSDRVRVMDEENGISIRSASTQVDSFSHTADVHFRLWQIESGRYAGETRETHKMRFFFPQEFELLLRMSGFECLSLSNFPEFDQPLDDQSWNALAVARAV